MVILIKQHPLIVRITLHVNTNIIGMHCLVATLAQFNPLSQKLETALCNTKKDQNTKQNKQTNQKKLPGESGSVVFSRNAHTVHDLNH